MSETTTAPEAPAAPAAPDVSDAQFESYFNSRGAAAEFGADDDGDGGHAARVTPAPAKPAKPAEPAVEAKSAGEQVPLATLLEERRQRQATQAEIARLTAQIEELKNPKKPDPATEIPEFGADPEKFVTGTFAQMKAELDALKAERAQQAQHAEAVRTHQELMGGVRQAADAYMKEKPDYLDAAKFLVQSRAAELKALKWNDEQIRQDMDAQIVALAIQAKQSNGNVAAMIYNIATARGFTPKQAAAAAVAVEQQMEVVPSPESEKLKLTAQGHALATSIQTPSGGGGDGEMTAARLSQLDSADFDAFCSKYPAKARRLMGG